VWFAPILIGAAVGAFTGAAMADMNGQNVWKGMAVGGVVGGFSGLMGIGFAQAGVAMGIKGVGAGILYGAASGAVTGGVSGGMTAALMGTNVEQGMKLGAITGGITGAIFGGIEGGITANREGKGIWWGNKIAANRSKWSPAWWDGSPKYERLDGHLYYRHRGWSGAYNRAGKLSMRFATVPDRQPVEVSTYKIRKRGYYVLEPLESTPTMSRNHLSRTPDGKTVLSGSNYEVLEQIHFSYDEKNYHYGSWRDAALCNEYKIPVTHRAVQQGGDILTEFYPNNVNLKIFIEQQGLGDEWFKPINSNLFHLK
jgi:hypothetical protein